MQEKDWENQEEDCEGRTRCHLNILLGVAPASFSVFSLFSVFSVLADCMVAYGRHAVCMVLEYCTVQYRYSAVHVVLCPSLPVYSYLYVRTVNSIINFSTTSN